MASPGTIGVVIPVFNEHRLPLLLNRFDFAVVSEVVVVDDGSYEPLEPAVSAFPVTLIRLPHRSGVGAAIRAGLLYLQQQGHWGAVVMAGNNKDDPRYVVDLVRSLCGGADYVQGSRYIAGVHARGTPLTRRIITRAVAWTWSVRFRRRLTDVTNGFRAYRLKLLDDPRIDLRQQWLDRYELEYYLHYKVQALGLRYSEVAVTKEYPNDGRPTSKIRLWRDAWSLVRPLVLLSLRLRK